MKLRLSEEELCNHRDAVRKKLEEKGLDALCLFSPRDIFYLTGLYLIQTERPVGLLYDGTNTTAFVPTLEVEHVEKLGGVHEIISYEEYPGEKHPMEILAETIEDRSIAKLGVDSDGYPGAYGYEGPSLSEFLGDGNVEELPRMIEGIMQVKTDEEVELIKESCRWGNLAHRYLQDYTEPGKAENEISTMASLDASRSMLKTVGDDYYSPKGATTPATAGFRGQIGKGSAIPHALTTNETIDEGDVLVTGASAKVGGYVSELERTMIVGEPWKKQVQFFESMVKAGEVAMEAIEPGASFADVDRKVRAFYKKNDLMDYWRHHTGHSIGFAGHEAPYLDRGDDRKLEPGMVVTVEPGIYVPDFAGFRHSDTVLVTEGGSERLTYYPRDLESLVIPSR
ncbi:MAG: Xaa-Pro peptidase family protein [Candidatus Bipolaricaulota bacterium]|nr:aminopeptidase P family protein [Candidatus Bipolaricaulota bacterium]MBS3792434.1 aminopeptidase P family protein [Candidatus Bipolaricaulota bacterium]